MITRDGQVKLLDFGIAKLLSAETAVDEATLTRIEDAALTPEYAAPEQLLGELPSTATDVYQLGMLLYVLLTGQHPLQQSGTRAEKIRAALDGIVPRASELADSPIRKQLRGDLDAILAMALRKLPNERYATAQTLQDELVRYLNHEPVLARRGATWYRARKFVSRHRFAVGTSAVAAVGLCAALAFALLQAREAEHQRDRAQLETKKAEADRRFAESMMSEIGEPDKPITPRQVLEKGLQLLESQYSDDPDFVVRTLIGMSGRFMDMGDRQGEYDALVKAEGIARQHGDLLSLANVQCNTVETEIALGRLDRAEARLAEGKDLLSRASGVSVGDRVDCLHAAASLSDAQGRTNDAIRDVESSAALLEQNGLTTDIRYAPLLQHLAGLYASLGNTKMSYEYNHRATLAMEKSGRTGTVAWEAQMHNEAIDLRDCGELLAAFDAESKVLNRNLARSLNDDLPAPVILAYAGLLVRLDRTTEAMPWLDRAQAVAVRAGDRGMIMAAHVIRGKALLLQNRIEPASAEIKIVTDIAGDDLNGFRALIARAQLFHADVLVVQAKLADANRIAVSVLEQTRNPELGLGIYLDDALLGASRVASAQGRHADAESLAREALQIDESRARDPAQSADVGEAALQLASIKSEMNDRKAAIDLAARASIALGNSVGAEHSLTRAAQRLHAQLVQ
jgi:serine/threonine-protein kinase